MKFLQKIVDTNNHLVPLGQQLHITGHCEIHDFVELLHHSPQLYDRGQRWE